MTPLASREQLAAIVETLGHMEARRREINLNRLDRIQAAQLLRLLYAERVRPEVKRPGRIVLHARHGTPTGYYSDGCRCQPCGDAGRDYRASRKS